MVHHVLSPPQESEDGSGPSPEAGAQGPLDSGIVSDAGVESAVIERMVSDSWYALQPAAAEAWRDFRAQLIAREDLLLAAFRLIFAGDCVAMGKRLKRGT